jgi:hypothetical protein
MLELIPRDPTRIINFFASYDDEPRVNVRHQEKQKFDDMWTEVEEFIKLSKTITDYILGNYMTTVDYAVDVLHQHGFTEITKQMLTDLKENKDVLLIDNSHGYVQPLTYLLYHQYNVSGILSINNNMYGSVFWDLQDIKVIHDSAVGTGNNIKNLSQIVI